MQISAEQLLTNIREGARRLGGKIAGLVLAAMAGILIVEYGWAGWGRIFLGFFGLAAVVLLVSSCDRLFTPLNKRFPRLDLVITVITYLLVLTGVGYRHSLNQLSPTQERWLEAFEPEVVRLEGVVLTEPQIFPTEDPARHDPTARLELRVTQWAPEDAHLAPLFRKLRVNWRGPAPQYGQVVRIRGSLQTLELPANPVGWDWQEILARRGIYGQITAYYPRDCQITPQWRGNPIRRFAFHLRDTLASILQRGIGDDSVATSVILGLVLGIRDFADPQLPEMFRESGTLHLFAVSGLHVGMVLLYLWLILGLLQIPTRQRALILIPILILYALITGLRPPVVRAGAMASLVLLGLLCQRRPHLMRNLAAAALILLAVDPAQLFQPGFQFSFTVLTAIVIITPRVMRVIEPLLSKDPFLPHQYTPWPRRLSQNLSLWAAGLFSTSVAAFLGSLPLAIWHFHMLSPVGVVLNLIAIPLAFVIVGLGICSLLTGWLPLLSILLNNANLLATHILLGVISLGWQLPGSHIYLPPPDARPDAGEVRIVIFSYRDSSSAILLQTRQQNWLVDCADARSFPWTLEPALNYQGINRLDGLILTHGDSRHIGAAQAVLQEFQPRQIWLPTGPTYSSTLRDFQNQLQLTNRTGNALIAGNTIPLGDGVTLEILHPPAESPQSRADERAAVLLLRSAPPNPQTALLMSDAGFLTEQNLIPHLPQLHAPLIIYSGHPTDFFATSPFINRLDPAAIYHGGPQLSHPRKSLLTRIAILNQSQRPQQHLPLHDTSLPPAKVLTLRPNPTSP